jgi:putative transposase
VPSWREIRNAIFYVAKNGCHWRALPHDFPPWQSVYHYFRVWRINGMWERLNKALREELRQKQGRHKTPSAAILDSQSVKSAEVERSVATINTRTYGDASDT